MYVYRFMWLFCFVCVDKVAKVISATLGVIELIAGEMILFLSLMAVPTEPPRNMDLGDIDWWKTGGRMLTLNTLRPRRDGRHFPDNIFKCIFLNENERISIKISLKFVPKGPINKIPALVQIMAWHRPGAKPLSEPMMFRLPTHIGVARPQWVNT